METALNSFYNRIHDYGFTSPLYPYCPRMTFMIETLRYRLMGIFIRLPWSKITIVSLSMMMYLRKKVHFSVNKSMNFCKRKRKLITIHDKYLRSGDRATSTTTAIKDDNSPSIVSGSY